MRSLLLTTLLLTSTALAQNAPPLTLGGILETAKHRLAVVTAPKMALIVGKGQRLGPYEVTGVGGDSVELAQNKQNWKLTIKPPKGKTEELQPQALTPAGPDDAVDFWVQGLERVDALTLLAAGMEQNIWIDPSVKGKVELKVSQGSLRGLLESLVSNARLVLEEQEGFLLVVPASGTQRNLTIPGVEGLEGKASFNFVDAPLHFVVAVLAREARLNFIVGPDVNGSVTLATHQPAPVKQLFALICQGQKQAIQATATHGFLIVATQIPEVVPPAEPGPEFDYQPRDVWAPTLLSDVLFAMANKMKLKLVLPRGFRGKAYLNLYHVPALEAAERLLAIQGYRCRVDNGQLVVEAR
ncbi:MAG: hypothetical protein KF760_28620 [Candidatus Eremiobacteraeota bacterium]|nr:hypothetical protein [Candidatus Eremiobacteraeota bacterium]MCW5865860.1 hypothetical protein [Candidatus Eremiobacteraeota bacterium]